ncbi:MAG: hypothetical protein C4576_30085 [Desulfobacteraceae bacterium]|nr:MAG: hypothetical protein C4576_30085 [Desulfobacteraceae bacterium]
MKRGMMHLAAIVAGGVLLLSLLYFLIVLSPAHTKRQSFDRHVVRMKNDLIQMTALKSQWEASVKSRAEAEKTIEQRGKGFTLLSHLEGICRQLGIEGRIQYMKPLEMPHQEGPIRATGIEMRLSELDIRAMVLFLYRIEHSGQLLSISRIKIRPSAEEGKRSLELVLQINTCM